MTASRRKRLIEVAFPMEEVSAYSRPEKNAPPGHISALHIWWARRPLAACRAFIYASLIDDPHTSAERDELLKEVADIASWNVIRHPKRVVRPKANGGSGLTGEELLRRARRRILACNDGKPPKLLDPFAGGGAIPLEGLRLGCEVEASDLNPVAVLILKGTVEYPQKYGQPGSRVFPKYLRELTDESIRSHFRNEDLAEAYKHNPLAIDVRYWGHWMLARAREKLAEFYPTDPDGCVPIAYLWSRTITCPSCQARMPLIRQYWLARKPNKKVALSPIINQTDKQVNFEIVEGAEVIGNPAQATTRRGDTKCLLCGQVVKAAQVHDAGRAGDMDSRLTGVVIQPNVGRGKQYRLPTQLDLNAFESAKMKATELRSQLIRDLPAIPDEPLAYHPQYMLVREYGLDEWGKLFNPRQLLALTTFSRLVEEAHSEMENHGICREYAGAIATYLGLMVDRIASQHSTLSRWEVTSENHKSAFARQAFPMVWDYSEAIPIGERVGSWSSLLSGQIRSLEAAVVNDTPALVAQSDAIQPRSATQTIITDPPYYDSINYSDLSDFFYVWLKRSLGFLHPDLLALPLTPMTSRTGTP